MFKRIVFLGILLIASALFGGRSTQAQTFFNLTVDHCTLGCGTSPFGTVELQQDGANKVLVTVNLLNGDKFISTGLHTFVFDIANSSATIAVSTTGYTAQPFSATGYHQDGFGDFPYAIECTGCGNGGSAPLGKTLSFTVTDSGLTPAGFISNGAAIFSADILSYNGNTGPVGTNVASPGTTPEPASMALFGTGLVAIGAFVRRRLKVAVPNVS